MTRKERLIKALIHFHYKSSGQSFQWKKKQKAMVELQRKIGVSNQYSNVKKLIR